MTTLLVYDIEVDKTRLKMSEACLDYGLQRVQYSAFLGRLNHNRRQELFMRLRRILGEERGSVRMFVLCDKDMALHKEVDNEMWR